MNISKELSRQVTDDIRTAVDAILAKHGLVAGKVNTHYGIHYKFSIEAVAEELGENGVNLASKEATAYQQLHKVYDLPEGLLGKIITVKGEPLVFLGIAASRSKYPYAFRKANGETTLYTDAIVPYLTGAK